MISISNLKKMNEKNLNNLYKSTTGRERGAHIDRQMAIIMIAGVLTEMGQLVNDVTPEAVQTSKFVPGKLSDGKIKVIRMMIKEGMSFYSIGKQFSVPANMIRNIAHGKIYKHVK